MTIPWTLIWTVVILAGVALVADLIAHRLPQTVIGRIFGTVYHLSAAGVRKLTGGAVRVGRWVGGNHRAPHK